jgi:flavin-dependent dehydrogenase
MKIVIVGGGIAGLSAAMILARDGHEITLLERNPDPPPSPELAWSQWERRGVTQFRQPHGFHARFRELLDAELPDVAEAIVAAGGLRVNRLLDLPPAMTGGYRPGDERFESITGRRPMVEAVFAGAAARELGVSIRRGDAVRMLVSGEPSESGIPQVAGVVTDSGDIIYADLVVDAGGRRSAMPDHLRAMGARRPLEDVSDCGFVYYARHFHAPGSMPALLAPPLQSYDSVSWVTLPADNDHWSVVLVTSSTDVTMRAARDVAVWERLARSYPLVAHWLDGEPTTGVDVIAGVSDRIRHYVIDGGPVATGVVAVADAWACTNPSVGRGAPLGLLHVTCLRDVLHDSENLTPGEIVRHWNDVSERVVKPYVMDTLTFDRHRLRHMEAQIIGYDYETDDPAWAFGTALAAASRSDPELLRAHLSVVSVLARSAEIAAQPGIAEKVFAAKPAPPLPGPTRSELLELAITGGHVVQPA